MEIRFTGKAEQDLAYWKQTGNTIVLKKVRKLLEDISDTPFSGLGKHEPLKHQLTGKWSRRINHADRLIYQIADDVIYVSSLRGHYK